MTLTEQDAARLAEIRTRHATEGFYAECGVTADGDIHWLLGRLDTKPAGEFVTKAWHNARVVEVTVDMAERMAAAEAALRAIADCPATMAPGMVWQDVADRMARYAREALP